MRGFKGKPERRPFPKTFGPSGRYRTSLPITKQAGPTVEGVLVGKPGLLDVELERGQEVFEKRVASKVDYMLSGGQIGKAEETVD